MSKKSREGMAFARCKIRGTKSFLRIRMRDFWRVVKVSVWRVRLMGMLKEIADTRYEQFTLPFKILWKKRRSVILRRVWSDVNPKRSHSCIHSTIIGGLANKTQILNKFLLDAFDFRNSTLSFRRPNGRTIIKM